MFPCLYKQLGEIAEKKQPISILNSFLGRGAEETVLWLQRMVSPAYYYVFSNIQQDHRDRAKYVANQLPGREFLLVNGQGQHKSHHNLAC